MSRKVAREAPEPARAAKTKRSRASSREPAAKPAASGTADALLAYSQKRDFGKTAEPKGRVQGSARNRFCVQKHDATRLHYDLRLELEGVLKSWAVTRGPSLVPGEKRLAVHVEDHPIEYNTFEGTIPQGEYGGGTVLIWDRGKWYPDGDPHRGLAKGSFDFTLEGEKLHGRWHMVRMRGRPGDKKENWLLIKAHDEFERSPKDPDILEEMPQSVVSGRTIPEIAAGKGKKRVWHSNRPVKDSFKNELKKVASHGNGAAGASAPVRASERSPRRSNAAKKS